MTNNEIILLEALEELLDADTTMINCGGTTKLEWIDENRGAIALAKAAKAIYTVYN